MLDSFRALVNGGPDWAMNALPNPILLAVLAVVIAVFSYFLGCSNGAIIVSKYILHNDVRNHGSGNAGLTNFHRVFGGKLTLVVILSGGAIAIMMDWRIALVVWGGFLILAILTKYVSLGSCWAGASFPFATWFVYHNVALTLLAALIGGLILWKHRGNIQRLIQGNESKFSLHKKKEGSQ